MSEPYISTIKPLTSLRFVAAMLVLAHHVNILESGYSGITLFFVLSGFILAYNYYGNIAGRQEVLRFWWKRFARIYPLHALTFVWAAALVWFGGQSVHPINLGSAMANLTLVQSWVPEKTVFGGYNWVSWSISDEAFFYALFPTILLPIERCRARLASCAVAAWIAAILAMAIICRGLPKEAAHWLFYINPLTRLVEFAVGCLLGVILRRGSRWRSGSTSEFAAVASWILSLVAVKYRALPYTVSLSLAVLPASIFTVAVFAGGAGVLSRILSSRILMLFGEASFALYMIHQLAIRSANFFLGSSSISTGIGAALAIRAAIPVHLWIERPAHLWLARRYGRKAVPAELA